MNKIWKLVKRLIKKQKYKSVYDKLCIDHVMDSKIYYQVFSLVSCQVHAQVFNRDREQIEWQARVLILGSVRDQIGKGS